MRCVIFDLDGTLADTSGDLLAAANTCFRELGHGDPLDPVADRPVALRGGRAMLRLGFDRLGLGHEQVDALFPVFVGHYDRDIAVHTFMFPGAVDAVTRLRAAGYRVGICTNKPEAQAEKLMRVLGLRELFDSLIGADTLPTRKPDVAPYAAAVQRAGGALATSLIVGDTVTDRDTARAAGVPCILVTMGPSDVSELEAEAYIDHFDALDQTVRALIG